LEFGIWNAVAGLVLRAGLFCATSWTFDARDPRDPRRTYHVVVVGGLTILDGTRVTGMPGYPGIERDYERTFETLKHMPCDIFLGAHASYYGGMAKMERSRTQPDTNPFVDPQGPPSLRFPPASTRRTVRPASRSRVARSASRG